MSTHDVIVVGAGSGGLVAARVAAHAGLRVLVLDRSRRSRLGHDWCDVVEEGIFAEVGLARPPPAMHRPTTTPAFASPSLATILRADEATSAPLPFLYLDRKRWLDALARDVAEHPNIELRDDVEVTKPLLSGTRVYGVCVRRGGGDEPIDATWVVDASGAASAIGRHVPYTHPHAPDPVHARDMFVAVKEMIPRREAGLPHGCTDIMLPGYAGGFGWMMSFWEGITDVGVALPSDRAPGRLRAELDRLRARLGVPREKPWRRGGGVLPARRARTRLVGDGWVVIGDAACQVNPSNGAGIASSMRAGHLAARAIVAACRSGPPRATRVWSYPHAYLRTEGAAYAGLDALRVHFQRFDETELEDGFARKLITHRDLIAPFLDAAIPALDVTDALSRGLRGATRPRFLVKLLRALAAAQRMKRHYERVPAEHDEVAIAEWERGILREAARW